MLLNYLKITLKVLGRNRFFTFVSLFGIVFTLLILLVLTSFLDHLVGPHYPEVNRDRSLYIGMIRCRNTEQQGQRTGPPSYHFLETYVSKMQTPEKIGIASFPSFANAYVGNKRLKLNLKFADAGFWEVTAFQFLEGKSFTSRNIDNGDYVAVISEKTRTSYFGEGTNAVGQTIVVENIPYRVIGVVRDVPITRIMVAADVYLPYNVSKSDAQNKSFNGNYIAILLAGSKDDFPAIRTEYEDIISRIELPREEHGFTYHQMETRAVTYLEYFLNLGINLGRNTGPFYLVVGFFMLLFMLLPAINLVNLNVSRIMERSSEIGVRKAFGASSGKLVVQFLVENVFITFLGGGLALFLALIVITIFNDSGLISGADLVINGNVLLVAVGVCLVFGLLSGVVPAYRMSRLHVIDALRGGEGG